MKTRWKILLGVVIFLAVFIGVWLLDMHVQPENVVKAYKKELLSKGEKLEIGEMVPTPIPEAENGAAIVTHASKLMGVGRVPVPIVMKEVAPGKGMPGWSQPMVSNNYATNSWDDVRSVVAANRPATQLLQQILKQPRLDFHLDYNNLLDYSNSWQASRTHFTDLVHCRVMLCATIESDLHDGDAATVTTNLCVLVALAHGIEDERLHESQSYRVSTTFTTADLTWDYLQSSNITDSEPTMLQKGWEQLQFFEPLEKAYAMDRNEIDQKIERMRGSSSELYGFLYFHGYTFTISPVEKFQFRLEEIMWRDSWSFSQQLRLMQRTQIILETLRSMETNTYYKPEYDAMTNRLSAPDLADDEEAFYRMLNIDDFSSLFEVFTKHSMIPGIIAVETQKRMTITAIAIRRFQLADGHLPEKLSDLTPKFIASAPIDTMDGKPLRYHPNPDGTFLLYSVGYNVVDDGGDPTHPNPGIENSSIYWTDTRARDWVWPQLATAAEIEKYYTDVAARSSK